MLEGITIALQSHYDTANGAKDILEKAVAQIKANYIGAMLAEKMKEAQEIYNNTLEESRNTNFNACVQILDEVANQVKKVVATPVPSDFIATLEAMKNVDDKTEREIESVVGTYKNNYWAYRAVCSILGGNLKGFRTVTIDEIIAEIEDIRKELHQCFFVDNIESYHFHNWLKGNTTLAPDDKIFKAFTEGRFEDAVQPDADAQDNE